MTTTTTLPPAEPAIPGPGRAEALAITGWVLAGLVGSFLLFDGVNRLLRALSVVESSAVIGRQPEAGTWIAIIELVFLALYLVPRTSVVGAILLTAFLGAAVAANVEVGTPFLVSVLAVGIMLWVALSLQNPQLRRLMSIGR